MGCTTDGAQCLKKFQQNTSAMLWNSSEFDERGWPQRIMIYSSMARKQHENASSKVLQACSHHMRMRWVCHAAQLDLNLDSHGITRACRSGSRIVIMYKAQCAPKGRGGGGAKARTAVCLRHILPGCSCPISKRTKPQTLAGASAKHIVIAPATKCYAARAAICRSLYCDTATGRRESQSAKSSTCQSPADS